MSNAPDRFALFMLGPDEKRVEIAEDTQIPNAATITLNKEDHTLGNMLRHAVLVVPGVLFCGYRVPHPLEPRTQIKIQTDGSLTPVQALQAGCESVISQIGTVRQQLRNELQAKEAQGADLAGAAGGPPLGAGAYGYGDVYGQGDAGGYVDI